MNTLQDLSVKGQKFWISQNCTVLVVFCLVSSGFDSLFWFFVLKFSILVCLKCYWFALKLAQWIVHFVNSLSPYWGSIKTHFCFLFYALFQHCSSGEKNGCNLKASGFCWSFPETHSIKSKSAIDSNFKVSHLLSVNSGTCWAIATVFIHWSMVLFSDK